MSETAILTATDLRNTYLISFDNFATDPGDVAQALGHNTRYARELLGTLVTGGLLSCDTVNQDEGDVWQVANPGTLDDHTREEAEAVIDAWLTEHVVAVPKTVKKTRAVATGAWDKDGGAINCLCGCGLQVMGKSLYKPGHDARHAGQVARTLVLLGTDGASSHLDELPTAKLRDKAIRIAAGMTAKETAKAARADAKIAASANKTTNPGIPDAVEFWSDGEPMKVGRWTYPTRVWSGASGLHQRNAKQDGSGAWVDI